MAAQRALGVRQWNTGWLIVLAGGESRRMGATKARLRPGLPSLAVPYGFTREVLPTGLQLIGRPFQEAQLYNVGHR